MNNQVHTLKWEKMTFEENFDATKSPFLKNKNLYNEAFKDIKEMFSNLKNKIKVFPFVGASCIRLLDVKKNDMEGNIKKVELKSLQKGSQFLNISIIDGLGKEKSSFVTKKAFRELFSEGESEEEDNKTL